MVSLVTVQFEIYDEQVLIGVIGFEEYAIIATGHVQAMDTDTYDEDIERLMPVYEKIITGIGLAGD